MFQGGWQRSYWTTSIWNPVWLSHTNSQAVSHQSVTVHAFPKINSECLAGIRNTGFSCRHFFPFWICFLDLIATHYKARNIFLIQWHGHISSKNKDNNKTDQILIRKQGIIVEQNCLAVIENWKKVWAKCWNVPYLFRSVFRWIHLRIDTCTGLCHLHMLHHFHMDQTHTRQYLQTM